MSEDIPRSEIALDALKKVRAVLNDWDGSDWFSKRPTREIDHIAHLAYARLRMADKVRNRRPPKWLAKVCSFSFPRELGPEEAVSICFIVQIVDGSNASTGRLVEIRMTPSEAAELGGQMTRMAAPRRDAPDGISPLEDLLPKKDSP